MKLVYVLPFILMLNGCGQSGDANVGTTDSRDPNIVSPDSVSTTGNAEMADGSLMLGGIKGNGGDAVVCFNGQSTRDRVHAQLIANRSSQLKVNPFKDAAVIAAITKLEILDLYEYKIPAGFPPVERQLMSVSGNFQTGLTDAIKRLKPISEFSRAIENELINLPLANWRQAEGVVEIDDSAEVFFLPSECILVQAAVRQNNQVFYDAHLWNRMDEQNHLGLVMHELIFKMAVDKNQTTSDKVRQIVGLILSESELLQLKPWEVYLRLKALGDFSFPHEIDGSAVTVRKVFDWFVDLGPKAMLISANELEVGDLTLSPQINRDPSYANVVLSQPDVISEINTCTIQGTGALFNGCGKAQFANRQLRKLTFDAESVVEYRDRLWSKVTEVELDAGKNLRAVNGTTSFESAIGTIYVHGIVTLDEAGKIRSAAGGAILRPNMAMNGHTLVFDADENLIQLKGAINTGHSCDYKAVSLSTSQYRFRICYTDVEFYPNAEVKSLHYSNQSPDATGLVEILGNGTQYVRGVMHIEVSLDGKDVVLNMGPFGVHHNQSAGLEVPYRNRELRIVSGEVRP
jgi:hypothetical protein